jgi:phosphoglycolate phosphatase
MTRNIFFDLDGTLINAHKRLYQLFCDLVPGTKLSFGEYWNYKKNKISHEILLTEYLSHEPIRIKCFQEEWIKKIEETRYLDMDEPFPEVRELLERLHRQYNLYIISHRQSSVSAQYQIDKWGWRKYFKKILITNQKIKKADMILKEILDFGPEDILVGDTGDDIMTAKQLQIISVAVLSGFLNKESLIAYQPDYIFNSVSDIDFEKVSISNNKNLNNE